MASKSSVTPIVARPQRSAEERAYIAAVLTGIYASQGKAILHAQNHEYDLALKSAKRVAVDQARVVTRGSV